MRLPFSSLSGEHSGQSMIASGQSTYGNDGKLESVCQHCKGKKLICMYIFYVIFFDRALERENSACIQTCEILLKSMFLPIDDINNIEQLIHYIIQ